MTTDNPQQIVFIDSRVPDIQDLLDGLQPGVQAFVLDSNSDGVQQIADILAAGNFSGLSSISIVSHGLDGEVMLGSTTLSEANLASHSRALAEIGASMAQGGDIQLYGCDVALGSAGQQFINDFSTLAGGANVEAATHIVGSAAFGGSWTLDASSNNGAAGLPVLGAAAGDNALGGVAPAPGSSGGTTAGAGGGVASPFTSQALANFQGALVAPPDGQLWFVTDGGTTDTREEFVDSNGTSLTDEINDGSTTNPLGAFPADIVFDPGTSLYFVSSDGASPDQGYGGNILEGTLYSTAAPTTAYSVSSSVTTVSGVTHGLFGEQLAIDTTQHIVYLGIGGSNEPTNEGILKLSYNPTTGSVTNNGFLITASQTGINGPFGVFDIRDMALDAAHHEIYFVSMVPNPAAAQNQIYAVDINSPTTATTLFAQSLFPLDFSNGFIIAVAVDTIHGQVYFATESQHPDPTSTLNAIWEVSTAGGTPVKVANYPVGTYPNDLTFDPSSRQLIISNTADNVNDILFEQLNSTGLTITGTSSVSINFSTAGGGAGEHPEGLAFDALPTLSGLVGTGVQPTEEHGAVTLASGITITDIDSPSLAGATVFFGSGSFAGASDVLAASVGGTNITASYNTATETLLLSGQDTFAHYAQVLDSVTFTAGENPTDFGSQPTRVIDWVVTDGLQDIAFGASNSASTSITVVFVNDPPTLTGLTNAHYTEEGAPGVLSGAVTVTDPDDLNLKDATVKITGGSFAGDTDVLAATTTSTNITASYDSTSQTLTLSGTDTLAHYQQVLDSVTFSSGENPTNFGSNLTRTITWVAQDPSGTAIGGVDTSTLSTTTVTVTNVNDPPTLALGTTVASWTEEGAVTTLSPTVTATDPDNLDLVSATVSITGGAFAGDTLLVSGQTSGVVIAGTNITPTFSGNGLVTFSGSDTLADYQSALELVTYQGGENPTDFGSDPTRTLTWTLNDGGGTANGGSQVSSVTSTVSVTFINDAPTLSSVAGSAQYTEEGTATRLSSILSVTDVDDVNLSSATVSIAFGSFLGASDLLGIGGTGIGNLDGGKISYSYNSSSETLTLTGTDTLGQYQTALDDVTFSSGENPTNFGSNTTRSITWQVQDPSGTLNGGSDVNSPINTTTVTITNVNDPPTLALGTTVASWTEEGSPATLAPTVTVTDPDNQKLVGATVSITGGTFSGDSDVLSATATGNITVNYNSSTETLTLTGSDSLANYQTVLDSVTFHAGENPTDFGSDLTRTITWVLNDGVSSNNLSTVQTTTVSITNVNDPPTLAGVPSSVAGAPTSTVTLSPSVTITDADDLNLVSASVSITGGTFPGDGDVLSATGTTSITVSYNSNTELLTLTGTDTLAHYQTVLDSVVWHSTAGDPTNVGSNPTRTISWVLNDGSGTLNGGVQLSTPQTETLTIDQPPTLSGVAPNAFWTEEASPTTLSNAITISDPDGVNTQLSATVSITGGTFANDHDVLAATATGNITVSYNSSTETLTLTGSDSLANYQTVLDSVTFNAGENPTDFGSNLTRTVTWTVADHLGANSAPQTTTVSLTNVNDPPTLSNVATSAAFTQGGAAVTLAGGASVSDPDSLKLTGATVAITGGTFAGDGDVLAASTAGTNVTASYNSTSETLTLSGSDTLAHYQQVLDAVTFNEPGNVNPTNFGSNPTRTVTWVLNDGSGSFNLSTAVTETISIAGVNQPPTLSNVATNASYTEEGAPATLASAVSVTDPDNVKLAGATVSITGGTFAGDGDVLAASTAGTSITASYNSSTETLTLSGSDTLANYQTVLDKVTFAAGENPNDFGSNPTRTLTWVLNDGSASSNLSTPVTSTVSITNVNDPPTFSNVPATVSFRPSHTITIAPTLGVADPDNLKLASATVAITAGSFAGDGDILSAVTTGTSITASYNSSTETLTLTGSDTLAHYQQVFDSVTFQSGNNPGNGNANRTRTVTWTANDGSAAGTATTTIQISRPPLNDDFAGTGNSDLLLQNTTLNGNVMVDLMTGLSVTGTYTVTNPGGPSWQVVATGDFNGDGKADIVVQNSSGAPQIWLMNGTTIASTVALPVPPSSWHIIATGDFNGDGQTDILWQNTSGQPAIWEMNGTSIVSSVGLLTPPASWRVIGAGDFNGDGKSDILWQNADGTPGIWEMNGTSIISAVAFTTPPPQWHVVGAGDFNGDGNSDILWTNTTDNTVGIWEMNGTSIISAVALPMVPPLSWTLVGAADVNGDGMSDLLWQNQNTSQIGVWEMNGTSIMAAVAPTTPGNGWQLKVDGPISPDQMGTADPPPGGTMHVSAPDTANGTMHVSAPDTANGAMHLSMPDGANGTGAVNATGLPPNFAAPMDGLGAAQLTPSSTTVAYSLHVGA